jgi:hypothetical protein
MKFFSTLACQYLFFRQFYILYIKATVVVSVCYKVVCFAQPCHSFYSRTVWTSKGGAGVGWEGGWPGKGGGRGRGRGAREGFFFSVLNYPGLIMDFRTWWEGPPPGVVCIYLCVRRRFRVLINAAKLARTVGFRDREPARTVGF